MGEDWWTDVLARTVRTIVGVTLGYWVFRWWDVPSSWALVAAIVVQALDNIEAELRKLRSRRG